jgi:thioester reductase-like protein
MEILELAINEMKGLIYISTIALLESQRLQTSR